MVETKFIFTTTPHEGNETGTLFALYPHQWRNSDSPLLASSYNSVRGPMKLGQGSSFDTRMMFPGILPSLPDAGGGAQEIKSEALPTEIDNANNNTPATHWKRAAAPQPTTPHPRAHHKPP